MQNTTTRPLVSESDFKTGEPSADTFKKEPSSKKAKIAKIALISAASISLIAGAGIAFRSKGGIKNSFKEMCSNIKSYLSSESSGAEKVVNKAKSAVENIGEYQNGANNIGNIKDSVARHYLMKIPGFEKVDNFLTGLYNKGIVKTVARKYQNAQNAVIEADKSIIGKISESGLDEVSVNRLYELAGKRERNIIDLASQDAVKSRFDKVNKSMERLDKGAFNTVKKLKRENLSEEAKRLSKTSVSEVRLDKAKKLQNNLLSNFENFGLTENETAELKELVSKVAGNDSELVQKFEESTDKLKKVLLTEKGDMFDKLRDINHGSAPGDVLGILSTLGLLGIYTAQADSKEEKVSVSLTTGIPLIATLGTTIVATLNMVSGAKALALAGLTGFAANVAGKAINNSYQKAHGGAPEKTIATIEDCPNILKDAANTGINIIDGTLRK